MEQTNNTTNSSSVAPTYQATTESQVVEKETIDYIAGCKDLMDERTCTSELTANINNAIDLQNSIRQKGDKLKRQKDLTPYSIAMLIAARGDVALIGEGDKSQTGRVKQYSVKERNKLPVGYYQADGYNKGVWEADNTPDNNFSVLAVKYKPTITQKEKKEAFGYLKNMLTVIHKCVVPYYAPVNNGIYDMLNKKLLAFSPDIVFTSKIHTNLNVSATNPYIPVPEENNALWNVDDWLDSLGSRSFVESIKEVIQAACSPLVPRNKMVLFLSFSGNSGKGTICELIRNLVGHEATISIAISEFSAPFGIADLPNATAIVTDENNVDEHIKDLRVLKAVITGDVVKINQKYEKSYDFQFRGLVLQCINSHLDLSDKTDSLKRRLHIIPFPNCFTGDGTEKKYIKERLIYREDVLEYILKMVLVDMPYKEEYTETEETKEALSEYESFTNNTVAFLDEVLPTAVWNLLPATELLYEAYKKWSVIVNPSGKILGRNEFIASVKMYVKSHTRTEPDYEWEWTDSTRTINYIDLDVCDPIASEYDISPFTVVVHTGNGYKMLKEKYSGLKRRNVISLQADEEDDVCDDVLEDVADDLKGEENE